jgi:hypothetical protein
LGASLFERVALDQIWQQSEADALYLVATHREEIRFRGRAAACFVEPGLLKMKLQRGPDHPLLRAVRGDASGDRGVATVLDGTVGLAHDALFIAAALGVAVRGIERSLPLACMLEEGLARLARQYTAAKRIEVAHGDALEHMRLLSAGAVDVVYLDPMMSRPKGSSGTFSALRELAWPERATPALLDEARRVASGRVVLKLGRGAPLPPGCSIPFQRVEHGKHVSYHVSEHRLV